MSTQISKSSLKSLNSFKDNDLINTNCLKSNGNKKILSENKKILNNCLNSNESLIKKNKKNKNIKKISIPNAFKINDSPNLYSPIGDISNSSLKSLKEEKIEEIQNDSNINNYNNNKNWANNCIINYEKSLADINLIIKEIENEIIAASESDVLNKRSNSYKKKSCDDNLNKEKFLKFPNYKDDSTTSVKITNNDENNEIGIVLKEPMTIRFPLLGVKELDNKNENKMKKTILFSPARIQHAISSTHMDRLEEKLLKLDRECIKLEKRVNFYSCLLPPNPCTNDAEAKRRLENSLKNAIDELNNKKKERYEIGILFKRSWRRKNEEFGKGTSFFSNRDEH